MKFFDEKNLWYFFTSICSWLETKLQLNSSRQILIVYLVDIEIFNWVWKINQDALTFTAFTEKLEKNNENKKSCNNHLGQMLGLTFWTDHSEKTRKQHD